MRLPFEFIGTTTGAVDLDPEEFRGMKLWEIALAIETLLDEGAPGVSFSPGDMLAAAHCLQARLTEDDQGRLDDDDTAS